MAKRKIKKATAQKETAKIKSKTRTPASAFAALFAMIVPIATITGFVYFEQMAVKVELQRQYLSYFKPVTQQQIELSLANLNLLTSNLSNNANIQFAMKKNNITWLSKEAEAFQERNPETVSLRLIPFQSIQRPDQVEPKMRFTELEMMRKLEKDEPVTLEVLNENGKEIIRYGITVKSEAKIIGTILINFDKSVFSKFFSSLPPGFGYLQISVQGKTWFKTGTPNQGQSPYFSETLNLVNLPWRIEYHSPSQFAGLSQGQLLKAMVTGLCASLILLFVLYIVKKAWLRAIERNLQSLAAKVSSYTGKQPKGGYTLPGFAAAHRNLSENIDLIKQKLMSQANKDRPNTTHDSINNDQLPSQATSETASLDMDLDLADDDLFESIDAADANDFAPTPSIQSSASDLPTIGVPAGIFRQYDIRGIIGESLSAAIVSLVGKAIGTVCLQRGDNTVIVGRDGRTSSPELAQALSAGLISTGCHVIDIGITPTPLVYFGTKTLGTGSGVMVTGSHNPPNYNGLKIVIRGQALFGGAISNLYSIIEKKQFATGDGEVITKNNLDTYLNKVTADIKLTRKLKVVLDTGNGVAGPSVKALMEKLGCEYTILHENIDGTFPNHHPDPSILDNMQDLVKEVKNQKADVGMAFDGDGDRLGVVTPSGQIIFPDRLLMLFIKDILPKKPGGEVIYDVKCTGDLAKLISELGGKATMWKTGHSLIKSKINETNAVLGGEMSGHIFFNDRWYGFDDGLYCAARLLELICNSKKNLDQMVSELPQKVATPELNISTTETKKFQLIEALVQTGSFNGRIITLDGIRVEYGNGWGLIRASNTTPNLVARFEATEMGGLSVIKEEFRANLKKVDPSLILPF